MTAQHDTCSCKWSPLSSQSGTFYSCESPPPPQVWVSAQEPVSVRIGQQIVLRRESLTCLLAVHHRRFLSRPFRQVGLRGTLFSSSKTSVCTNRTICTVPLEKLDDYCTPSHCKHLPQAERRGTVKFYLSECSDVPSPARAAAADSSRCAVGFGGLDEI